MEVNQQEVKKEIIQVLNKKQIEICEHKEAIQRLRFETHCLVERLVSQLNITMEEMYALAPDIIIDSYMRRFNVNKLIATDLILKDINNLK